MLLLAGTYLNCQTIRGRAKKVPELEWARNLAAMIQLAMVTFLAGSQLLSDATQSMPYELVALSVGLRGVVERRLAQDKAPLLFREEAIRTRPAPTFVGPSPTPVAAYATRR